MQQRLPAGNGLTSSSVNHDADLRFFNTPTVEAMEAYDRLPPRVREAIRTRHCEMPPTEIERELAQLRRWERFHGEAEAAIVEKIKDVERSWLAGQPQWWASEMAALVQSLRAMRAAAMRRGRAA